MPLLAAASSVWLLAVCMAPLVCFFNLLVSVAPIFGDYLVSFLDLLVFWTPLVCVIAPSLFL